MSEFELRTLSAQHCELRAVQGEDGEQRPPMIVGYGAVFNLRSELLGGQFVEEIAPGAFDGVLTQDVRGLFNHNPTYLLGRLPNGTLRLSVDARGLRYEIDRRFAPYLGPVRALVRTHRGLPARAGACRGRNAMGGWRAFLVLMGTRAEALQTPSFRQCRNAARRRICNPHASIF